MRWFSMKQYKVFGPDAEVTGLAMMAFTASLHYHNFSHIMAQHGLDNIYADRWYPQQVWLDLFSDIAKQSGAMFDLVSIGMKIVDTAVFPPEVEALSFPEVMMYANVNYLANNRGRDIGSIQVQMIDERHLLVIDQTPYPDDFVYGTYYALARRFLAHKALFTVKYEEKHVRREQGGAETRVHITWERRNNKA